MAVARGEAFVDLDTGLAIMSHHAQQLGYDAVVLFLDELILWLATRAGDVDFVSAEGAKLSKLVEAQRADRPIPIISFVARQRDLRELIGEHQAGALEVRFIDTLKYWEAQFDRITLEDRNLPVIAETPPAEAESEAAKQEMDAAFDSFRQQPPRRAGHAAWLGRRAGPVPHDLSVQPGAGAGADRCFVGVAAGADRAEADADAAGEAAGRTAARHT